MTEHAHPDGTDTGRVISSPRELIVVARRDAELTVDRRGVSTSHEWDVAGLNAVTQDDEVHLHPLFGSEPRLRRRQAMARDAYSEQELADLVSFYHLSAP